MWHLYGTHMVGFWYLEVVSRKPVSGYLASKVAPAWGFAAAGLPRTHIILLSGHPVQHPWNGMNGYIFLQFAFLPTCQWILDYVTSIERAKDRRPVLTVMGLVIRGRWKRGRPLPRVSGSCWCLVVEDQGQNGETLQHQSMNKKVWKPGSRDQAQESEPKPGSYRTVEKVLFKMTNDPMKDNWESWKGYHE